MADDIQEVVRCKKFELVDDEGRVRVSIGINSGDVDFSVFDEKGGLKLEIEYDGEDDDTCIALFHENSGRVSLGLDKNGKAYFIGNFQK